MPGLEEWDADVLLADGGVVGVRSIRSTDREGVEALHARLSGDTVSLRFAGPLREILHEDAERVLTADFDRRVALAATVKDEIVGLAYYDKGRHDDEAEVAFLIEDAHQGRGLGSVVLEHLSAIGREAGLARFVAEVLPANRAMLGVFRECGFGVDAVFDGGTVRLLMDLSLTSGALAVMRAREQRAEARSVERLLRPRAIAVVGASQRPGAIGHEIFRRLIGSSFEGPVFPVNVHADYVAGVLAYQRMTDLPRDVDLAFVATPPESIGRVIAECAARGVRSLVILSGGFTEVPVPGQVSLPEVRDLVRSHGMRLVGPECMGVINTDPQISLNGTLLGGLPHRGRVGFFSQSGALSADVMSRAFGRGVGVSTFVSAGSRADVSGNDLLQYWLDDASTDVVLMYMETFGNPQKFARLARAVSRQKPIVALQAAFSGDQERAEVMYRQSGVIRVESLGEMLDVAGVLTTFPLPAGGRVAIIGNMTALGRIAVAAASLHGLDVAGGAPVDLGAAATLTDLEVALRRAIDDPEVDAMVTTFLPTLDDSDDVASLIDTVTSSGIKPVLVTSPGKVRGQAPTYGSPEEAVRALAHVVRYARWRALPAGELVALDRVDRAGAEKAVRALASIPGSETRDFTSVVEAYGIDIDPVAGVHHELSMDISISNDRVFGRAISVRVEGIPTDLFGDVAWRALPMTDVDAERMLDDLAASPLLRGYAGGPRVRIPDVVDVIRRAGRLGVDLAQVATLSISVGLTEDGLVLAREARGALADPSSVDDGPRRLT